MFSVESSRVPRQAVKENLILEAEALFNKAEVLLTDLESSKDEALFQHLLNEIYDVLDRLQPFAAKSRRIPALQDRCAVLLANAEENMKIEKIKERQGLTETTTTTTTPQTTTTTTTTPPQTTTTTTPKKTEGKQRHSSHRNSSKETRSQPSESHWR